MDFEELQLTAVAGGCVVPVRVHPGARRNAVVGVHAGALKVSLTAPPTDGRANDALMAFLAELLHVSQASVSLVSGKTNRSKRVRIGGLECDVLRAKLLLLAEH